MELLFQTPFTVEQRLVFVFVSGFCFGAAMLIAATFLRKEIKEWRDKNRTQRAALTGPKRPAMEAKGQREV